MKPPKKSFLTPILTVQQAKGLEFDTVFTAGMTEDEFPGRFARYPSLATPRGKRYSSAMSAREAILDELKNAPESLVREAYDFIVFLKQRRTMEPGGEEPKAVIAKPDFLARQQTLFGSRALPDSQALLDELRADRF
jgi:UvrD-like helicase C-terminal domain